VGDGPGCIIRPSAGGAQLPRARSLCPWPCGCNSLTISVAQSTMWAFVAIARPTWTSNRTRVNIASVYATTGRYNYFRNIAIAACVFALAASFTGLYSAGLVICGKAPNSSAAFWLSTAVRGSKLRHPSSVRAQGADEPRVGRVQEASLALTAALAAGTGLFVSGALCEQLTLQYDYYNCERISFVMRCALGACAVPLLAGAASVASGNAGRSASGPMELAAPDDVASKPIVKARWSCGRWFFAGAMLGLVWLVLALSPGSWCELMSSC
jgi:hypothetical protein